MDSVKLNTGGTIPPIGFGTWEIPPVQAMSAVEHALWAGYRLFDTARIYGNEAEVGDALRRSGHKREEYFLTTKVWNDDQGYDATLAACQASLDRLEHDFLDLYLIHWPATSRRHDSWEAMEQLVKDGKIKAAGVSNYTIEHLEELLERSEFVPAVNQVEFHPFIYKQQKPLLEFCQQKGILIEAYSPLSRLSDSNSQPIQSIADATGKSIHQVVLRWCIQHGTIPLPRSTNPEHATSNFDVFDFELTDDHMEQLNHLSDGERVTWDPAGMGK